MRPFRLAPARSARGLVTRPRLLALLGERFDRRLVLVVAGAGFGKSTLLAQAVAENRLDPRGVDVWLSCSPDDAAASQLAAGLLAALDAEPSGMARAGGDDRGGGVAAGTGGGGAAARRRRMCWRRGRRAQRCC